MDFSAWNWATSFRLHEAACLIAGVMPISKRQPTTEELPSQARPILVKLMAAYVEWHLQKRNPDRPKSTFLEGYLNDDGALPEINSLAELPGALASREAINRFLLQIEGELGLKSAYDFGPICKTADPFSTEDQHPTQRTPTPDEPCASTAPDYSMLATRAQLIQAFGAFTGMDLTWFRNLKDTPALLNARKVTGQGGRGHLAEPLFCPLEVMQWLVSGKRKKGRPLSLEKAWELLERHFPKVHSANSAADPRAGD